MSNIIRIKILNGYMDYSLDIKFLRIIRIVMYSKQIGIEIGRSEYTMKLFH